jgi:hypothetical protein
MIHFEFRIAEHKSLLEKTNENLYREVAKFAKKSKKNELIVWLYLCVLGVFAVKAFAFIRVNPYSSVVNAAS